MTDWSQKTPKTNERNHLFDSLLFRYPLTKARCHNFGHNTGILLQSITILYSLNQRSLANTCAYCIWLCNAFISLDTWIFCAYLIHCKHSDDMHVIWPRILLVSAFMSMVHRVGLNKTYKVSDSMTWCTKLHVPLHLKWFATTMLE